MSKPTKHLQYGISREAYLFLTKYRDPATFPKFVAKEILTQLKLGTLAKQELAYRLDTKVRKLTRVLIDKLSNR